MRDAQQEYNRRQRWKKVATEHILACHRCPVSRTRTPTPFYGYVPNDIAIVGEAPGREENEQGRPFVGTAGKLLRGALTEVGFEPEHLFYTNSAMCQPIANGPPTKESLERCFIHLRRSLEIADPKYVLLLGGVALNRVRPGTKITPMRGQVLRGKRRTWMATYHPSYIARNPGGHIEAQWLSDLSKFYKLTQEA